MKNTAVLIIIAILQTWLIWLRYHAVMCHQSIHHETTFQNSTKKEMMAKVVVNTPKSNEKIPCKYMLFANGAKCGSTALFMYLERVYRDVFIDLKGKESCFHKPPPHVCTPQTPYLIDGCPRSWGARRMGFKHVRNRTSIILLVRPQADRMQSEINDKMTSGNVRNSDSWVSTHMKDQINNFTLTYQQSIDLFDSVKIVHHDELLSISGIKSVFSRIFPDIPSRNVSRPIHPNRFAQRDPRHRQIVMSLDARWKIEDYYEQTNCDFYRMTNMYISGDKCG